MDIALIWAMSENRVIGRDNTLPWRLPNDMKNFMAVTMGKPVVMGRKTLESMKAPLPGRTNIVLTTNQSWQRQGVEICHDLEAALEIGQSQCQRDGQAEVMVIGGADIYALALPVATRLYVTHVHADIAGDVYFPEFDLSRWQIVSQQRHDADERHSYDFTLAVYELSAQA